MRGVCQFATEISGCTNLSNLGLGMGRVNSQRIGERRVSWYAVKINEG